MPRCAEGGRLLRRRGRQPNHPRRPAPPRAEPRRRPHRHLGRLGAEKPTPAFFAALVKSAGCEPAEIAYVGDRLDNDILPALDAGLTTVFIRRGPWGYYYATQSEVEKAHVRIDSLADLPERLRKLNSER